MILDFYYWFNSAKRVKIDLVAEHNLTLYPKQFSKLRVENPDLSFYELSNHSIKKEIINTNWITSRGAYLDDKSFEIYLFNEGEYEFSIKKGSVVGTATLERISFADWIMKDEKN